MIEHIPSQKEISRFLVDPRLDDLARLTRLNVEICRISKAMSVSRFATKEEVRYLSAYIPLILSLRNTIIRRMWSRQKALERYYP